MIQKLQLKFIGDDEHSNILHREFEYSARCN